MTNIESTLSGDASNPSGIPTSIARTLRVSASPRLRVSAALHPRDQSLDERLVDRGVALVKQADRDVLHLVALRHLIASF